MKRVFLPSVSLQIIDESYDSILKQWDCNLKESHGGFAVFLEANLLSLCLKTVRSAYAFKPRTGSFQMA